MFKKIFLLCLIIFVGWFAFKNQPRYLIAPATNNRTYPTKIEEPEYLQSIYAEMKGDRDYYTIVSDQDFLLKIKMTVPALSGELYSRSLEKSQSLTGVSFEVRDGYRRLIGTGYGDGITWTKFYENYIGFDFYKGAEYSQYLSGGTYYIYVSDKDNIGKYVMTIGHKTVFDFAQIWNTIGLLQEIKMQYLGKDLLNSYFNTVGLAIVIFVVVCGVCIFLIVE